MSNAALNMKGQIEECRSVWLSFAYFLNNYVFIENKETKSAMKLKLWPAQEGVINSIVDCLLLVILKARQLGLTWLTAAYVLWRSIRHPLHLTVVISVNEDLSIEFLDRIYFILDRLPEWLHPQVKTRTKQTLEFAHHGGTVSTIKSMPTTEMGAQSKTPNILVLDETCMNRMIASIYNSSMPGIEAAKGQVIVISNSIKTGPGWGWTRDIYTASMKGMNGFKRIFLPWSAHPGRPEDFRARMIASGMDQLDVAEHYPETEAEALAAATGGYFGETLARHTEFQDGIRGHLRYVGKAKDEVEFIESPAGPVRIWRYPYEIVADWDGSYYQRRYAIGSDVSEGLGQTTSTAYVIDRSRDELVAKIKSARIDAVEWAEQLRMLSLYYADFRDRTRGRDFRVERTTSLVCVEVTGSGQTTVKEMIKKRVNQYVRMEPDKTGSGLTKRFGWPENQKAKYELAGDLKEYFKTTKSTIYDAELIEQAAIFIRHENGKLGHEEGVNKYDDDVIGAGLTIQASMYLGAGPERIVPPVMGRREDAQQGRTIWAA
jgi:hypothetical protein